MSRHKDHHSISISVGPGSYAAVVVLFRWRWQAWLMSKLLDQAVAARGPVAA